MKKNDDKGNQSSVFLISILLFLFLAIGSTLFKQNFRIQFRTSVLWLLLVSILLFVIELLIHEVGHCIVFLKNSIKIKAAYLIILVLFKEHGSWHLRRCNKQQFLMGGMVVPDLPSINSEEDYQSIRRTYAKALLGGPIISIFSSLLLASLFIILAIFNSSFYIEYYILGACSIIFCIGILINSTLEKDYSYGDFKAHHYMKADTLWSNNIILSDLTCSDQSYALLRADQFLNHDIFDINKARFLVLLLDLLLSHRITSLTTVQENAVDSLLTDYDWMNQLDNEVYEILSYRLVLYLVMYKSNYYKGYELFQMINEKIRFKREYSDYYIAQCEQILKVKDHTHYLSDRSNIITSSDRYIRIIFDSYYHIEEQINSRLFKIEV